MAEHEWWNDFFDDVFASVVLDRPDPRERKDTLQCLENMLQLKKGDSVFDQCCGTGAISHTLAGAGYNTHGVDVIPSYIDQAQTHANAIPAEDDANIDANDAYSDRQCNDNGLHRADHSPRLVSCTFVCADARNYAPAGIFDAAINWYTSFGYSQDDADNIKMLKQIHSALKIGGRLAMDITNMSASYRKAEETTRYEQDTKLGRITIERDYFFDVANGMRGSNWRYTLPDGTTQEKSGISRLYSPRELTAILEKVGFEVLNFYGDLQLSPLSLDSTRCICVAQKKAT